MRSQLLKIQQALSRSILVRIGIAVFFAYSIVLGFRWLSKANDAILCSSTTPFQCWVREALSVVTLDNIEGFSILLVAVLYILESKQRKQQSYYEAWQVIDAASGVETSYARSQALQYLNREKVSLRSIDAPSGDLENIDLSKADLEYADFRGANLKNANFSHSNLKGADFSYGNAATGASLQGADLMNADLEDANLSGTDLRGTNLSHARLHKAVMDKNTKLDAKWEVVWTVVNQTERIQSLRNADLRNANLSDINFSGVDMRDANLQNANLSNSNLSKASIKGAVFKNANLTNTVLPRLYQKPIFYRGHSRSLYRKDTIEKQKWMR